MKPPPMPSGDLRRIVIDALAGSAVQVWKRHTYDSGPYEVTMLRDSTERIARAVEAATLARAVPAGWNLVLRDLVALEADGKHADESAVEVWERARAVLAGRDGGAAMKPPPMPEPHVLTFDETLQSPIPSYTPSQLAARDAQWAAIVADAVAAERERAAKLCDEASAMSPNALVRHMANGCANAIRFPENGRAQTDSKGE